MASVIRSANNAGVDIFAALGTTARVINKTMSSAAYAVDTLELKSRELYDDTATAIAARRPLAARKLITETVREHVNFLEENHKALYPNEEFDRKLVTQQTMDAVKKSVAGQGPNLLSSDQVFPTDAE